MKFHTYSPQSTGPRAARLASLAYCLGCLVIGSITLRDLWASSNLLPPTSFNESIAILLGGLTLPLMVYRGIRTAFPAAIVLILLSISDFLYHLSGIEVPLSPAIWLSGIPLDKIHAPAPTSGFIGVSGMLLSITGLRFKASASSVMAYCVGAQISLCVPTIYYLVAERHGVSMPDTYSAIPLIAYAYTPPPLVGLFATLTYVARREGISKALTHSAILTVLALLAVIVYVPGANQLISDTRLRKESVLDVAAEETGKNLSFKVRAYDVYFRSAPPDQIENIELRDSALRDSRVAYSEGADPKGEIRALLYHALRGSNAGVAPGIERFLVLKDTGLYSVYFIQQQANVFWEAHLLTSSILSGVPPELGNISVQLMPAGSSPEGPQPSGIIRLPSDTQIHLHHSLELGEFSAQVFNLSCFMLLILFTELGLYVGMAQGIAFSNAYVKIDEAVEGAETGLILFDEDAMVETANRKARVFLGADSNDEIASKLEAAALLPPKQWFSSPETQVLLAVPATIENLNAKRSVLEARYRKTSSDGPRQIVCTLSDLTRQVEQSLDLERQRGLLSGILNSANVGIICLDSELSVVFSNDTARVLLGYTTDTLLHTPLSALCPNADTERAPVSIVSRVQGLISEGGHDEIPNSELLTCGGERLPVSIGISAIDSVADYTAVLVFSDISALLDANAAEAEKTRQLESANKDLMRYADHIAHDIRAPIRSTGFFVEAARDAIDNGDWEGVGEAIDDIDRHANQAIELTAALLKFSQAVEATDEDFEQVNASEIIQEALDPLFPLLREKKGEVSVEGDAPLRTVPRLLATVVRNIIDNSIKYSRLNSPPAINVKVLKGEKTRIIIEDNGKGISPDFLQRAYMPFKREEESDLPGAGIGLTLSKRTIEKLNGTISLENNPSGEPGVTATLTLPGV